jgi:hypothetical protein
MTRIFTLTSNDCVNGLFGLPEATLSAIVTGGDAVLVEK